MEGRDEVRHVDFENDIARCLLWPKFTDPSGVFAGDKCYAFRQPNKKEERSDYIISIGHLSKLKSVGELHEFGCRTASKANERMSEAALAKQKKFDRVEDGIYYIGSYILDQRQITSIESTVYQIAIEPFEELGETAHYHLCSKIKDGVPAHSRSEREALSDKRLDIIRALHTASYGPLRHVCVADLQRQGELSRIIIPDTNPLIITEDPLEMGDHDDAR